MARGTNEFRIGCVPYLNARPLIERLACPVRLAPPRRLAQALARGALDAALLPVLECFRRGYATVPGVAIASDGPVQSVLLHLRVPPGKIRVCALDRNSMTSNALARILLERRFGARPRYGMRDPSRGPALPRASDAAVTIGDNSFRRFASRTLDLGAEWKRFTGLPFVYALWCLRRDHPHRREIALLLRRAATEGLRLRREIARREAGRLGLNVRFCTRYLTHSIRYSLGRRERAGMTRFRRWCRRMELT